MLTPTEDRQPTETETELLLRIARNVAKASGRTAWARANGVAYDDLVQEAFIGALIAWRRFDPSKGVKLSTWAWRLAHNYAQHYLRDKAPMLRVRQRHADGKTVHDNFVDSLDRHTEDGGGEFGDAQWDAVKDPNAADPADIITTRDEFKRLEPKDRQIFLERYLEDLSFGAIARRHAISKREVSIRMKQIRKVLREETQ